MKKKFLLLFFSLLSFNAIHAEITWEFSNDGTLTISGTDMPDYSMKSSYYWSPWYVRSIDFVKKIVINDGVTNIGSYAFHRIENATSVTIPNSVTSIGESAFDGCHSLKSVTIPNSVTTIGMYAFSDCDALTSVKIPNSVTWIEIGIFYSCDALTSVTIPNSLTSIVKETFAFCKKLTSINIPNSVTSIGMHAFWNCSNLTSITIPASLTSIEWGAFEQCTNLNDITCLATTPPTADEEFIDHYGTLHVLPGCKAAYKADNVWKNFTIVEDASTGIDVVEGTPTISSDKIFSISGQQLNKTKNGVNIINGKKILVK